MKILRVAAVARSKLASGVLFFIDNVVRAVRRPRRSIESSQERRLYLFFQYEKALGSAINATPIFEALKSADPRCFLAVACTGPSYEILLHSPFIDHIFLTASPHFNFLGAVRNIWNAVSGQYFNFVVTGAGNSSGRFSALAVLSGIECRIGFTPFGGLYERTAIYDADKSVIENNLAILPLLGYQEQQHFEPRVFFTKEDLSIAEVMLKNCEMIAGQPIIAMVSQTSGGQPTKWYDDRFARVADSLAADGYRIIFLGTENERKAIDTIRTRMRSPSASLAGNTSVRVLAAILCHCDLVITLDTGPMHVGRAVQVPMVIIAAAWQPAHEWLPLSCDRVEILRKECMDEISDIDVIRAAERVLGAYPAMEFQRIARISRCLVTEKKFGDRSPIQS